MEKMKHKDLSGLIELLREFSSLSPRFPIGPQSVKMAINLTGNLMSECVDASDLESLSELLSSLLKQFPDLRELDNICFTLVKVCLAKGAMDDALKTAFDCKDARSRTFSAIIETSGKRGDIAIAFAVLAEIERRNLIPTELDFANMLEALSKSNQDDWRSNVQHIISLMGQYYEILETDRVISALKRLLNCHEVQYHANQVIETERTSASCGVCPMTGTRLRLIDLSDDEIDEMLDLTRRLALESHTLRFGSPDGFDFDSVISRLGSPKTTILDAANIAHTNQNFDGGFFRFDQIDDILSEIVADESLNRQGEDCLVVIHEKWLNPDRDLSLHLGGATKKRKTALPQLGEQLVEGKAVVFQEEGRNTVDETPRPPIVHPVPVDVIEKWKRNNQLLVVPHGQNDDWYWMHICLLSMKNHANPSDILLLSNDQMRDHFWRMKNPNFFQRFRTNHVGAFSILFGEDQVNHYKFELPIPFSIAVQRNGEWWHIPFRTSQGIRWFLFSL